MFRLVTMNQDLCQSSFRKEALEKYKMPIFKLVTNLPKSKIPESFLSETVALVAKTLEKPQEYCVVQITPDLPMTWGGSAGLCGIGKVLCIAKFGVLENKEYSSILMDHIENKVGIPKDKMYIQFVEVKAKDMGYNGTTFHEIFGMN